MSLDKILKKIRQTADLEAKKILEEGRKEIEEIRLVFDARFEELKKIHEKEKEVIDTELKNAILLPARLEVKGAELEIRHGLIDRVFEEALEFNEADYKKVLDQLFSQIPDIKGGTVHPAGGREEITKKYIKERMIGVEVGDSIPGIGGGFILKAGKIEYDCSFVTLKKRLKARFETEVAKLV